MEHHRALAVGRAVAHQIELGGRKHLADIGGGPGTYSTHHAPPRFEGNSLDPGVVEVAQEISLKWTLTLVTTHGFDYYSDDLPGRYDALISGVLHREQPERQSYSGEDLEGLETGVCLSPT